MEKRHKLYVRYRFVKYFWNLPSTRDKKFASANDYVGHLECACTEGGRPVSRPPQCTV